MSQPTRLIAGAMSGTSGDGVDVAVVRIEGRGMGMSPRLLAHHHVPYDADLRGRLFATRESATNVAVPLAELVRLGHDITVTYARAVNDALNAAGLSATELSAVAAHGQTLYHAPPLTLQWLDPSLRASEVGCAVVSDFRRADCAAGGQGAPLVPFADYVLFRHALKSRLLINLGGVANLTYVPADCAIGKLVAFDTGPGNCICDELMRELHPEGPGYDAGGVLAAHGKPDNEIALRFLADEYFRRRPPKSTDGPAMIGLFYSIVPDLGGRARLPDLLATACLITAAAIGRGGRDFVPAFPDEIYVSGGGTQNRTMMDFLQDQLGGRRLRATDDLGFPWQAKEAIAFALLAAATLDGEQSNIPVVTGARRAAVLGSITPKPH